MYVFHNVFLLLYTFLNLLRKCGSYMMSFSSSLRVRHLSVNMCMKIEARQTRLLLRHGERSRGLIQAADDSTSKR